ncbi:PREDICTED: 1-phosphatidylinositol 4,5-bisphosphate phosphodiesterase gamma-2-like isoform X2 [Amphimedon queenslandica]|uniref:SH3 domain-containing protein n=1 Tax=Amphimedon queenslandica TaxID=400682 RepID=A0AAN0JD80_AMPQE|nr:PREDICTED: 1-phosphatidylinositol 4,5-bisphosphate phosphodiesterase gamma-2-like isoform X2 [Amphimedon queenslandica]|eukprot:XP_019854980.1 PREDICTED: 1-phosphatidylinositol 4,5-bisphosphate phosphodiesterase gamma-2-like isoform X2 [Amphimedon queenslandica]
MEQLLEEGIDVIKANQGNMNQDPYYLQKKKQLTACHLEDSGMQSLDTSFAIATSQVKKEREANKRLEEKLQKLKEKHRIQHMLMLTNTGSALSRIRRGMRMEIEELILYLTANKSDLEDQNAAIVENKREIEYLQEQISSTSVQLLMKRKENEAMKADIKKEKQILSNQVKLLYEKDEVKEKDPKVAVPEKMEESTEKKILPTDTLLFDQPWFHAELTRNDAEMLLDDYKDIPGAFLVREPASSTNYAISFIFQQVCNHMMIQQKFKEGKMKYYLFRYHLKFDSIFELIEYYHQYPIIMGQTQNTFVMLTVAVPKINDYEARPWFSNVSKIEAEDMLNSVLLDGAFLVRPSSQESEDGKKALAISLRGNDKICHIRITKDGEQFTIGGPAGFTFGNLIELIYYYKYQPIYLNTKLTHPINKEILEQKTSSALMQSPHLHVYESIKEHPITVHALYDFKARRADELSFECGAVITNVEKIHEDWWRGEYKGSRGVFPASYVKEIL